MCCKVVFDEYIFERSGLFFLNMSSIMLACVQVSFGPQHIPSQWQESGKLVEYYVVVN